MDILCLNILTPEGAITLGITSCDCCFVIAGPWPGFGCHVLGWSQIRCRVGNHHWCPSHNRREVCTSLSGTLDGFHRRETLDSLVDRAACATLAYQLGLRNAQCVCALWVTPSFSPLLISYLSANLATVHDCAP